ncbi:hypothetical protein BDV96DRAFT_253709 [Lophiotrema nucula]|uniref:Rhodopsin domain-containing protein n=1 Tax=Lophiotrema nucula TaxID=690887 RepID=A0A6A5YNT0_9PLEO|nr:hypothetical protein BDV96DRAFT_253709 [Lophiotrema nucula]
MFDIDENNLLPNETIATKVIVTMALSSAFVVITLGMRLYCRFIKLKKPAWDDATIVLATICSLVQLIFNALFIHYGQGRHVYYLNRHQILQAYKFSSLVMFPFIFCTAITKISVGFMVLRLTQAKWMRYYMYALMTSLVIVNGGCVIILSLHCRPIYATWDFSVKNGRCWDRKVYTIGSSVQGLWSVVTDLVCTSTPLFMIWKLRMGTDQKIATTILIGAGLATTACSIGRCVYVYHATTKLNQDQTCMSPINPQF